MQSFRRCHPAAVAVLVAGLAACSRSHHAAPQASRRAAPADAPRAGAAAAHTAVSKQVHVHGRVLLVSQAQFVEKNDKIVPGPAKLELLQPGPGLWRSEVIEDPQSNVFHKAIVWRGGILTIAGTKAMLRHWTWNGERWTPRTLWQRNWGGKYNRLRDIEIGDVDGDGKKELVIATHDKGVVAIGNEVKKGVWKFTELGKRDNIFVHEIEIGDVDGDGKPEIYCTESDRNRANGTSQPGGVFQYKFDGKHYQRRKLIYWQHTHAKEILVTDLDGDGKPELYAVREAVVAKQNGHLHIVVPVEILRLTPTVKGPWKSRILTTIDDRQTRFLVPADVEGNGKKELVAGGMNSGLWLLRPTRDGKLKKTLIDDDGGGFEHAVHAADFDGDGRDELYVAADRMHELHRYVWNGHGFDRTTIAKIPPNTITWEIEDGTLPERKPAAH